MLQWLVFFLFKCVCLQHLLRAVYNEEFVVSYHSCLNLSLIQKINDSTN